MSSYGFGYDDELPGGYQDADLEMLELEEAGRNAGRISSPSVDPPDNPQPPAPREEELGAWLDCCKARGRHRLAPEGKPAPSTFERDAAEKAARLTHRERLEAKAEKRAEWAQGRAQKATTSYAAGKEALEAIPFGQPVHGFRDRNYRDKATAKLERSWEHSKMAQHHEQAAAGLERQLRTSIYDDDTDAIERLEEKIGRLEAERGRIKAYNAACRKAGKVTPAALELLDESQQADIALTARVQSYALGKGGGFPGYHLSNLSANINRLRKRLEGLRSKEA